MLTETRALTILSLIKSHTAELNQLLEQLMAEFPTSHHAALKLRIGSIWSEYGDQLGELVEASSTVYSK